MRDLLVFFPFCSRYVWVCACTILESFGFWLRVYGVFHKSAFLCSIFWGWVKEFMAFITKVLLSVVFSVLWTWFSLQGMRYKAKEPSVQQLRLLIATDVAAAGDGLDLTVCSLDWHFQRSWTFGKVHRYGA